MSKTPRRSGMHNPSAIEARFEESQNDLVLQASDFSLQGLSDMVVNKIIDLDPKYQRRERWDEVRESQLMESFLMNVPVPPIYLSEEEYGIYSIIDGKQRITAVSRFLNNQFKLKGLENFTDINGCFFKELPRTLQSALRIRPYLRVISILKQSDPKIKYEVFLRLNRGGIMLNNQEIRNVAFRGRLNDLIYRCAENKFLKNRLKITGEKSSAYKEMLDAEFVLRFFVLEKKWEAFSGTLVSALDDFMIDHRKISNFMINTLEEQFNAAIGRCELIWGDVAFQRWDGSRWRNQTLAGLYDAQMVAASSLSDTEVGRLSSKKSAIRTGTKALLEDSAFENAVRAGTNTPSRINYRIGQTIKMLRDLL